MVQQQATAQREHQGHRVVGDLGCAVIGHVGLGRIGTAVALRAKALGFRVVFFDHHRPNGAELAIGVERTVTLEACSSRLTCCRCTHPRRRKRGA